MKENIVFEIEKHKRSRCLNPALTLIFQAAIKPSKALSKIEFIHYYLVLCNIYLVFIIEIARIAKWLFVYSLDT